jgi:ATP-dependent Zn protease
VTVERTCYFSNSRETNMLYKKDYKKCFSIKPKKIKRAKDIISSKNCQFFFIYNIYNNYIINNKSDAIKILKSTNGSSPLVAKISLAVTSLLFFLLFSVFFFKNERCKRATRSGAFTPRHCQ